MMQWIPLTAVGDAKLASAIRDVISEDDGGAMAPSDIGNMALTICYCLNFQQGLKCGENPRPKVLSTKDIAGKTKIYNVVCGN